MNVIIFGCIILIGGYTSFRLYRFRHHRHETDQQIQQHLDQIRQQQVLLKPDAQSNSYSGKFAGRLFRFQFSRPFCITTKLDVDLQDDALWIYPVNYPFKRDSLKHMLERQRAWSTNKRFDEQFIIAGRPRHFAYAVIRGARRSQERMMTFCHSVITAQDQTIAYYPNVQSMNELTTDDWYIVMSIVAEFADSIEDIYEAEMFSGVQVDEASYPDHSGGHT